MPFSRPSGGRPESAPTTALAVRSPMPLGPTRVGGLRLRRVLLAGGALLAAILVAAQALLPAIAEHQIRSALGPQATGVHASIEAMPAIKLLWHRADRVNVTVDRLTPRGSGAGSVGEMLAGMRVAPRLDIRVHELRAHGMHLRDVSLHKDGADVTARADVDLHALQNALPGGLHVRPLAAPSGEIRLEGTLSALGMPVSARASLLAEGGRIVVRPQGLPIASLLSIPVFSDPRISVDGLGARKTADGMLLTARARLRGA